MKPRYRAIVFWTALFECRGAVALSEPCPRRRFGLVGFDPWRLTSPTRALSGSAARRCGRPPTMWEYDADRALTVGLATQITAARGDRRP